MKIWVIATLTLQESLRRRALLGAVLLTLAFLALFGYGSSTAFREISTNPLLPADTRTIVTGEILLAGLYGVANIGALLAIFVAVGTIATEVEEGTLHAIVPRPLNRWEIVLGKWLGLAIMVSVYVVVTGLAACLIVYYLSGYISAYLVTGLLLIALKALILLSISMLFSTFLPALTSGIIAFILYAVSNVTGMVEQFGHLIRNQTLIDIGIITSLVIPSDAIWKMAASQIQPPAVNLLTSLRVGGVFSVVNPPSVWMALYALVYLVAALGGALLIFQRRDL